MEEPGCNVQETSCSPISLCPVVPVSSGYIFMDYGMLKISVGGLDFKADKQINRIDIGRK